MNKLAYIFTDYLLKNKVISKDEYQIYQYGFECGLEILISVLCSIFIAILLHMEFECILFFVFFIPLRSYSGGLHLKSYFSCLLFSILTLLITLLIVKYCNFQIHLSFFICLISLAFIKAIGSVNHPNRPVEHIEELAFVRITNRILFINIIFSIIFAIFNLSKYLFLEAIVFTIIVVTMIIGKITVKKSGQD